jgi:transcriptional regulator with GAF, ATPase, and Fis domain
MVSVAQNRTLPELLRAIVNGIACCHNVALARIWLVEPGDLCATCRLRDKCPDQSRCLHLVASAGTSKDGSIELTGINGAYRRLPIGFGKVSPADSGEPVLLPGLTGDEDWIADPAWFRREGVRTFAGQPLVFQGKALGVLAIFDRGELNEDDFAWLRIFADHAAVSIANLNAFEEIAYLKERLEEENIYLREEASIAAGSGELIGQSAALRKVLQQIDLVAKTDATVLVTGESGTGKELVARAIHAGSTRKDRALIKVNCGAIPEPLFESEFFGHAKGAFTGALRDKPGRFELADGGTLFLDEIGEVPLAMQAKLLRVLQEQEIERVGEARSRKLNVRIIAATNRDLSAEVEAGHFRQDLFYRLSVFPIDNPPLRERREDIPHLADHFIRESARRMHRRPPKLTEGVVRELTAHDWPGNIRELQNSLERAVILADGGPLHLDISPSTKAPAPSIAAAPVSLLTRRELKLQEREAITAALAQAGGKVSGPDGAAALLGMKPTTLYSRITALGLKRKPEAVAPQ